MAGEDKGEAMSTATVTDDYGSVSSPNKMFLDDFYNKIGNYKFHAINSDGVN